MKTLYLERVEDSDQGTFGTLTGQGLALKSLELPWRDNERRFSCIPQGTYTCKIVISPRFGKVYGVLAVPDRSHILIHAANFGGDTKLGWQTDLEGCIAPFYSEGTILNKNGEPQRAGISSRKALSALMSWADHQPFQLVVTRS